MGLGLIDQLEGRQSGSASRVAVIATSTVLLGACVVLAGCGRGGPPEDDRPSAEPTLSVKGVWNHRDSSGVGLTFTDSAKAYGRAGWRLDSIPALILGDRQEPDYQFYGVRGLRGLPEGGVLVVDGVSRELRFFNADGELVKKAGGKGEGPGEFSSPELVQTVGSDSLLFWDHDLKRFQILSPDGQDSRTIRLAKMWPAGGVAPLGAVGERMLVRAPEPHTIAMYSVKGPIDRSLDFIWVDPRTGVVTVLERFRENIGYNSDGDRFSGSISIPMTPHPTGTVTHAAALITDGLRQEIREFGLDGTLKRVFRITGSLRKVTDDMVEEWWESRIATGLRKRGWVEAQSKGMPIPERVPAIERLLVDEVGWVWAKTVPISVTQPQEWIIFDPEGRAHGVVETPASLKIHRIGEDFILGVTVDDFGVERVYRYTLQRRPDAADGKPIAPGVGA